MIQWLLAYFHLSDNAVCKESENLGLQDYHDHCDIEVYMAPWHFHVHKCKRCGKEFMLSVILITLLLSGCCHNEPRNGLTDHEQVYGVTYDKGIQHPTWQESLFTRLGIK